MLVRVAVGEAEVLTALDANGGGGFQLAAVGYGAGMAQRAACRRCGDGGGASAGVGAGVGIGGAVVLAECPAAEVALERQKVCLLGGQCAGRGALMSGFPMQTNRAACRRRARSDPQSLEAPWRVWGEVFERLAEPHQRINEVVEPAATGAHKITLHPRRRHAGRRLQVAQGPHVHKQHPHGRLWHPFPAEDWAACADWRLCKPAYRGCATISGNAMAAAVEISTCPWDRTHHA